MQPRRFPARRSIPAWLTTPEAKSKGVPLPPEFIERWKRFFPSLDLRRVRVHWGIPARLTRLAGIPNPAAVSYRYHIYVDPRYADLNSPHGTRVILHELRHVAQWRAFGDRLYTMYQEANRRGYWRNPLEQDAYRYERLILAAVP